MKATNAYALLHRELEAIQNLTESDLVALVGQAASGRIVEVDGEPIEIALLATWQDATREAIRVTAHARGPSTWRHEHLQEAITIAVSPRASAGI